MPPLGLLTVARLAAGGLGNSSGGTARALTSATRSCFGRDCVFIGCDLIVHRNPRMRSSGSCAAGWENVVIAGGPRLTTGHEAFPEIAPRFRVKREEVDAGSRYEDLAQGRPETHLTVPGRCWPDLTRAPIPRWDLCSGAALS